MLLRRLLRRRCRTLLEYWLLHIRLLLLLVTACFRSRRSHVIIATIALVDVIVCTTTVVVVLRAGRRGLCLLLLGLLLLLLLLWIEWRLAVEDLGRLLVYDVVVCLLLLEQLVVVFRLCQGLAHLQVVVRGVGVAMLMQVRLDVVDNTLL